ncbi:MAG: D-alanyl-D-alanine carboxypeptidase [Ruminococcus sp.]|nr:D-alanyl-D-alanine carboxypeptidase [Ruminococcus sp.]
MKILSFISAVVLSFFTLAFNANAVDLPATSAKGAILIDAATGEILFEKNCKEKLPMASTTKIMSAMLALESGNLDEEFVVDSDAIKVEGSSMGLQEGDRVTMRALVHGMLLPSGNDAANAAAVRICGSVEAFVQLMNDRAVELGLTSTHFVTPSGLDDDTDEHYSSAYDMAILAKEALKNPDFREICGKYNAKLKYGNPPYERWLTNSNKLLNTCDGVIGVKTGFTDKAKRCLVSACERNDATLICVTLNAPNDWLDHSRLFDYGFTMFEKQKLPAETNKFIVNVVGGTEDTVECETKIPQLNMLRGKADEVTSEVYINHFLYAPVVENTEVGKITYYYKDQVIHEEPIVTSRTVGYKKAEKEQSFFSKCCSKLGELF